MLVYPFIPFFEGEDTGGQGSAGEIVVRPAVQKDQIAAMQALLKGTGSQTTPTGQPPAAPQTEEKPPADPGAVLADEAAGGDKGTVTPPAEPPTETPAEGAEEGQDPIEFLAGLMSLMNPQQPQAPTITPVQEPTGVEAAKPFELSDEEFAEAQENKEGFIKVMNKYLQGNFADLTREILKQVTQVTAQVTTNEVASQMAAQNFWKNNADLKPLAEQVGARATLIASQNPNMPIDQLYDRAGKEIRDLAAMISGKGKTQQTGQVPPAGVQKPQGFPPASPGSGRVPGGGQPKLNAVQEQIQKMLQAKQADMNRTK